MKKKQITLACDFDGVIKDNLTHELVPGAVEALHWIEDKGVNIIITTANSDIDGVRDWLQEHGIHYPVTDKKTAATFYLDDRAIRFINWNDVTGYF